MKPSSDGQEAGPIDPSRPADHVSGAAEPIRQPKLGPVGWLRFFWRQLTSMSTALVLLLMLAVAAIPGSLVPQRTSNPNGVTQYFTDHPKLAPLLDNVQMFDVYSSVWFSAIYLLLFVSLIGCVLPRIRHHWKALRTAPPRTPVRLDRLPGFAEFGAEVEAESVLDRAERLLRKAHYRVTRYERGGVRSVSAERGYLRETGNLVFHLALVGVLASVGAGGAFTYYGQRVIVEGQTFSNTLAAYDSFNPGRWFSETRLSPFSITLDSFATTYETMNLSALGQPIDYEAKLSIEQPGDDEPTERTLKVNDPVAVAGSDLFLLGNGYAPVITVKNADGDVVFSDPVPFLPQDANLTSLGVIKVTDGVPEQLGMIGFFYPTQAKLTSGAYSSSYPDLINPVLTLNVYEGDLGLDGGVPKSVYTLDTDDMTQVAGGDSGTDALKLAPGETKDLPGGGSVTFDKVKRYISVDIRHDVSEVPVLVFTLLAVAGLLTSLFVPRRRVWVAVDEEDGETRVRVAGLARGDDPTLEDAVGGIVTRLRDEVAGEA